MRPVGDCDAAFDAAVGWVLENLSHFRPGEGDRFREPLAAQRTAELAVALVCWQRHCPEALPEARGRCGDLLESTWSSPEVREPLVRSPDALSLVCYVTTALAVLGRDRPEDRATIRRLVDAGYLEQNERLPFRTMDIRLGLEWSLGPEEAAATGGLPDWDELCEASILGRRLRVPHTTSGAAYALTHALFFATAFGMRPPPRALARRAQVQETLSALLITFLSEGHWDLVGELLLSWEAMHLDEAPILQRGWSAFLAQQCDDGAFPPPEGRRRFGKVAGENGGRGEDGANPGFAARYHTTLVALMAISCRRGRLSRADGSRPDETVAVLEVPPTACPGAPDEFDAALETAVAGTERWLARLLDTDEARGAARPAVSCRLLLAAWLCAQLRGTSSAGAPLVERAAGRLEAAELRDPVPWTDVPAGLKLLSAALVRGASRDVPVLEDFLFAARSVLSAEPVPDPEQDLELCEKRVLLHSGGFLPPPPTVQLSTAETFARTVDLRDASAVDGLLLRTDSATAYGLRRPPAGDGRSSFLADLLTGLAFHHLRVYDLTAACRTVRTLSRLVPVPGPAVGECRRFLLEQHRLDGSFGLLGAEMADLRRHEPGVDDVEQVLLPVTLDCLWALAEGRQGWWLYEAVSTESASRTGLPMDVARKGNGRGADVRAALR